MLGVQGVPESIATFQGVAPRLVSSAHEFEAQLMKEFLKPLTGDDGGEDCEGDSGSSGAIAEFGAESFGRALSARGGFGIARSVIESLSQDRNRFQSDEMTGKLQEQTVLKTSK